jgi:phosphatidylserine/phosphatidylglycerophosphate/cardiolipin synthase-like enzyme
VLYEPYLHAKNILVDNQTLLITSMNLSTNAIENNREIGIVTQDKEAVNSFLYQFNKDKKNAKEI